MRAALGPMRATASSTIERISLGSRCLCRPFSFSIEPIIQRVLAKDHPCQSTLNDLNQALPPTPVTLVSLLQAAEQARDRPETNLLNGQFIRRELTARRAHACSMMLYAEQDGGAGLAAFMQQPKIQELKAEYFRRLRLLLEYPRIDTAADEERFYNTVHMNNCEEEGETRAACSQALAALHSEHDDNGAAEGLQISSFLDAFFSQRVGLRFLVEHYLASRTPRDGFAGLIQMECSPVELMTTLAKATEEQMHVLFGGAPRIEVHGDDSQRFSFVPSHIEFVVGELLHNAAKSTIRHHLQSVGGQLTTLPSIKVIVAASDAHVNIKVEVCARPVHSCCAPCVYAFFSHRAPICISTITVQDLGGGIPRSHLPDVWSYRGKETKRWGQGVGLGLPLARLYAKYFGGNMSLVPMEGHGTDSYVVFNRLVSMAKISNVCACVLSAHSLSRAMPVRGRPCQAHANSEHTLKVPSFARLAREEETFAAQESEERPNQGRRRDPIRLFDAMSRRLPRVVACQL